MRVFAKGFWGASASSVSIFSSLFIVSLLLVPFNPSAQAVDDLMELSLQDLLDVDVTSVSKKSERRSEAAAAIYVISNEDIRRSTATSIPDLLRTVPGVNVAQIDSHTWSVTVRGQAGEFATKLLVLVDGRSVYTPLFSGVFWDTIDLVLEDVDRIEVVRGPGGTIWGSNAVNGVINIVTKTAEETQGGLISVAAGTTLDGSLSLRYGDSIGDDHFYRIYTKGIKYDDSGDDLFGENANDNWEQGRGGFRYDHDIDDQQHLTIQADYYSLTSNSDYFIPEVAPPPDFTRTAVTNVHTGFNALGRWTNKYSDTGEVSIQSFFDMYHTDSSVLDERRKTIDLEFEHQVQMHEKHNLIWGLGYRYSEDHITPVSTFRTVPASDTQGIVSFFIQDEYRINDELRLTMGTKVEHNDYTDFEIQPTLRASWLASETQTLWAAVSRAVRTPNRAENDMQLFIRPLPQLFNLPAPGVIFGDNDYESLEVIAYELGYRNTIQTNLILDVALFYNDYENERGFAADPTNTTALPPGVLPLLVNNDVDFETYGVEVTVDYRPFELWTIRTSYSYMNTDDSGSGVDGRNTPENQASLTNQFQVTDTVQFDTTFRYVDKLIAIDVIDDYFTVDARIAWRPSDALEFSLNGRNLLDDNQIEFIEFVANRIPTGVERSVYGQITWEF